MSCKERSTLLTSKVICNDLSVWISGVKHTFLTNVEVVSLIRISFAVSSWELNFENGVWSLSNIVYVDWILLATTDYKQVVIRFYTWNTRLLKKFKWSWSLFVQGSSIVEVKVVTSIASQCQNVTVPCKLRDARYRNFDPLALVFHLTSGYFRRWLLNIKQS